jgi:crotonobetaine/carnitine-CoA ligase
MRVVRPEVLKSLRSRRDLVKGGLRAAGHVLRVETAEGTLLKTLNRMRETRGPAFYRDWTFADLYEWAAEHHGVKPFIDYGDTIYSFREMNDRANRVAHALRKAGVREGDGVALMLSNHPRFYDAFFAVMKLGAYAVPVNTALVGEGLAYILDHSEVRAVVSDHECMPKVAEVRAKAPRIANVWVNLAEAPTGTALAEGMRNFDELEAGGGYNLGVRPNPKAPSLLLYTSGTTGLPKAVVSEYGQQRVKALGLLANLLYTKSDKLYTCLPLFHANALLLTTMHALWVGMPVRLAKRFSASRFWKEISESGVTQFNTIGGMIPIMLKTPPTPYDKAHQVKRIVSAACPKDAWVPFETRFGVEVWEAYGAVDGAGVTIFNAGNAPVGSIGKPARTTRWRLADDAGNVVPPGAPGELQVYVGNKAESRVPYWKNEKASSEKVIDGWLHTGDLMTRDEKGFLYFVGRNTDSMRHRGENVSAFEVEKVVDAYPAVLESAAFGVPSPMGEQDVMVSVALVEGQTLDPAEFLAYCRRNLPKFAVPSFLDVVTEFNKTGTHRIIKADLKKRGVTAQTIRLDDIVTR